MYALTFPHLSSFVDALVMFAPQNLYSDFGASMKVFEDLTQDHSAVESFRIKWVQISQMCNVDGGKTSTILPLIVNKKIRKSGFV